MKLKVSKLLEIFNKKHKKQAKEDEKAAAKSREIPQVMEIFHKMSLEELTRQLGTSLNDGLDGGTAQQLLAKNGKNRIKTKKKNPILKIFRYFFSGFGLLFLLAAILCIIAWKPLGELQGNTPDMVNLALGILLFLVIFIQAGFNAFQDWSSAKVMNSIKNMMPSTAYVIRSGKEQSLPVEEIVVGDVVRLTYGNKVPADCRIIETKDLKFDKSMLTGESEAIEGTIECTDEKYVESKNIAFMTTLITNGQGKGIVVATGDLTMMGKIAGLTNQTTEKKTSLQEEIHRFVKIIVCLALFFAVVVIITWAAWLRTSYPNYINLITFIVNIISVVIGFMPDGLPVSVTISLLIIAIRMKKSRVLVKNLTVIETLSCVNVIASDKTGTLTQNKMYVSSAAVGTQQIDLDEALSSNYQRCVGFNKLVLACGLCNNAKFEDDEIDSNGKEKKDVPIKQKKAKGDATDVALLRFSAEYENYKDIGKIYDTLAEIPFNSKNKWMVKVIKPKDVSLHDQVYGNYEPNDSEIILLKGAPDYLIKKSTHIIDSDGTMQPIKPGILNTLVQIQNDWCTLGQRVLIICQKKCNFEQVVKDTSNSSELETFIHSSNDFCIIGLVGIIDPPREGIADVITKCKEAGIRVFMVTGDYALTAAAIAYQIGILTQLQYDTAETMRIKSNDANSIKHSLLLTGNDLDNMEEKDWRQITSYKEIVFARTTPEQKLKTVKEFQSDGYIVGVTGDGVNDAPALKSANIGIAMGSGSEVAMEASQLVLLDNNFASILMAIENGRLVFDNLRKVILFLLPGGSMSGVPVLTSIFLGIRVNLSSFAMLSVALFTDMPPSLCMMKEPPETDLLKQPPRSKKDHLVDRNFLVQAYAFIGLQVVLYSQLIYFIYMKLYMNLNPSQIFFSFDRMVYNYNQSNYEHLLEHHVNISDINSINAVFQDKYYYAQTVTFASIVILQTFGNLLATRTHIKSFFQQPPWQRRIGNMWFFLAQTVSILLLMIFIYVPLFQDMFNTRPIPAAFLFIPLAFGLVIWATDELRKLAVRRKILFFAKMAW